MSGDGEGDSAELCEPPTTRRRRGRHLSNKGTLNLLLREVVEAGLKAAAEKGEADVMKQVMPYLRTITEECPTIGKYCQTVARSARNWVS